MPDKLRCHPASCVGCNRCCRRRGVRERATGRNGDQRISGSEEQTDRTEACAVKNAVLIVLAASFTLIRPFLPVTGHSDFVLFMAAAHIYVGWMLCWLWFRRWRWALGWTCLLVPSLTELVDFLT